MPPLSPREKGLQDSLMRCHPGGDITDGDTDTGGALGIAGNGGKPAFALDQQVIGFQIPERPLLAIAGNGDSNQPRILSAKPIRRKAESVYRAGGKILDENIGFSDQLLQEGLVILLPEIKAERFLAPVQPDEIGTLALNEMIIFAGEIPFRPLHLDHPRSGFGEAT